MSTTNLKRNAPEEPVELDVDLESVQPDPKRRLVFEQYTRKFIPQNTLIASEQGVVTALALPSKGNKYIQYGIEANGIANKLKSITEQAFVEGHDTVDRMNVRATLAPDKSIVPSRLSANTSTVKRTDPVAKDTPMEEATPEEPASPVEETGITLDAAQAPEANTTTVTEDDEEERKDTVETQEMIAEEADASTLVPENKPEAPVEEIVIPEVEDPLSDVGLLTEYATSLRTAFREEKDIDKKAKLKDMVLIALQDIKNISAQDDMPPIVMRAEIKEAEMIAEENALILDTTVEQQQQFAEANESADTQLAGGKGVNVKEKDIVTGAHLEVPMDDTMDATEAAAADPTREGGSNPYTGVTLIDTDVHMSDENQAERVPVSTDQFTGVLEQHTDQTSSNSTSANVMEQTLGKMEVVTKAEVRAESRQLASELKIKAKEDARVEEIEGQMDVSGTPEEIEAARAAGIAEFVRPKVDPIREAERQQELDLVDAGVDLPGVSGILTDLQSRGLIEDVRDLAAVKQVVSILRQQNKVIDVKTSRPPTRADLIRSTVAEGTVPGVLGSSGVGTPVFVPGVARDDLHSLMNGVVTLTNDESMQLKKEMAPLWNEFKLGRIAAGVREMERMPSRLTTAPGSSVQHASKIREDETQQNITFGNFISWLLHVRLDNTKAQTWKGMLLYSTALGYNSLTQAQVNWIITGHENGDLDINTDFSSLNPEEGDPLDQRLEIKGQVIKPSMVASLSAQVQGNSTPRTLYPSRNTSPSAAPIDNSIHPDGSTGPQRANRNTFQGLPSSISNIPDPRFSMRAGEEVKNIRIATINNPAFDPTKLPGDPGYEEELITTPVDDLGAGSKDIGAHIAASLADRLLRSMPSKLYAPIHAQACDRYLGAINFQRLSMPIEKYMKSYSQHPFGPEDFQQMYEWNSYTMALYGTMLYAFVTDIQMQRIVPVFDLSTPTAVADEYMELNELISELARYQQASEDRAGRVGDDGSSKRPVEEHIDQYLKDQSDRDTQLLQQSNVVAISVPDTQFPQGDAGGGPPPGNDGDEGDDSPSPPPPSVVVTPTARAPLATHASIISEFDTGVRRNTHTSRRDPTDRTTEQQEEMDKRQRAFKMFQRQ